MLLRSIFRSTRSVARSAARKGPPARQMSKGSFDADMVEPYMKFFNQAADAWVMTRDKVKNVKPDAKAILDVGSGPGEPACTVAAAFPDAQVSLTDVSPDMIKMAESRIADQGLNNVTAVATSINDLSSFGDASQDVVTAQFVLMFTEDLPGALSEINRVLRPGGYLVGTVWEYFEIMPVIGKTMTKLLGQAPPPSPINPLSLMDPASLDGPLADAGFEAMASQGHNESVLLPLNFGKIDDLTKRALLIPVTPKLREMEAEGDADVFARAKDILIESCDEMGLIKDNGDLVFAKPTFRYAIARKPAQ